MPGSTGSPGAAPAAVRLSSRGWSEAAEDTVAQWVLQCNPTRWRIYDFFAAGHELTSWTVTRHVQQAGPGDLFALWVTGRPGGVVALGEVTDTAVPAAEMADEDDDGYWTDVADRGRDRYVLPVRITRLFLHDPLPRDVLSADPRFAAAAVLREPGSGNLFAVTDDEWAALHEQLDGRALAGTTTADGAGAEQVLRRRLFGTRGEALCALCGDVYPVGLLRAAHIKKRAACTEVERRDLGNVAMAACVMGCDALYEAGYLTVDASGHIVTAAGPHPRAVGQRLEQLARRRTAAHNAATEIYFAWHRDNTFLDGPAARQATAPPTA
ncbi:hypothetical protein GCM10022255_074620 [Dactylosporangium darangshiense]|uniref:EVE domain-containing protein n=1 Tax=Dactylosporangium darangshiense TaxID=579108 RepID=A0ABP8DJI9_9ACTN